MGGLIGVAVSRAWGARDRPRGPAPRHPAQRHRDGAHPVLLARDPPGHGLARVGRRAARRPLLVGLQPGGAHDAPRDRPRARRRAVPRHVRGADGPRHGPLEHPRRVPRGRPRRRAARPPRARAHARAGRLRRLGRAAVRRAAVGVPAARHALAGPVGARHRRSAAARARRWACVRRPDPGRTPARARGPPPSLGASPRPPVPLCRHGIPVVSVAAGSASARSSSAPGSPSGRAWTRRGRRPA